MSHNVGADELRVRARLRHLVDGPAAEPPPMPPSPPSDGYRPKKRDWLDDIADLDFDDKPAPVKAPQAVADPVPPDDDEDDPEPACQDKPRTKRPRTTPRTEQQADPRQSLLDAWDRTPRRIRWLARHATAAVPGWWLGWVDWGTDTAAWYAAGHWTSSSAFVLYGLGGVVLALYRRSRAWAWPAAWAATIPVSSVVLGVLLYGTGYQP